MATTARRGKQSAAAQLEKKLQAKKGFILDVGCGRNKQPGAVGMDHQALPGVDVVHSWNDLPWPFEDESVLLIVASHVVEHVSPVDGHFLRWMNECWRVLKPGRQIAIACPYGNNELFVQDPTHCNPCNQTTWIYFDPVHPANFWQFYEPKPWAIVQNLYHSDGMAEVVLRKRLEDPKTWKD